MKKERKRSHKNYKKIAMTLFNNNKIRDMSKRLKEMKWNRTATNNQQIQTLKITAFLRTLCDLHLDSSFSVKQFLKQKW